LKPVEVGVSNCQIKELRLYLQSDLLDHQLTSKGELRDFAKRKKESRSVHCHKDLPLTREKTAHLCIHGTRRNELIEEILFLNNNNYGFVIKLSEFLRSILQTGKQ
jgi:hypothetical protein